MFFRADYLKQTTVFIGQNEGLPNITGGVWFGGAYPLQKAQGAYRIINEGNFIIDGLTLEHIQHSTFLFNASNGETKTDGTLKTATEPKVYGASNHVTPCNTTVKVWKRIN